MNDPKEKIILDAPVPIKEEPPINPYHDNEVFGNPRSFPFLWKRIKQPETKPQEPEPEI